MELAHSFPFTKLTFLFLPFLQRPNNFPRDPQNLLNLPFFFKSRFRVGLRSPNSDSTVSKNIRFSLRKREIRSPPLPQLGSILAAFMRKSRPLDLHRTLMAQDLGWGFVERFIVGTGKSGRGEVERIRKTSDLAVCFELVKRYT